MSERLLFQYSFEEPNIIVLILDFLLLFRNSSDTLSSPPGKNWAIS